MKKKRKMSVRTFLPRALQLLRRMSKRGVYSIIEQHLRATETGREHFTHQQSGVSDFKTDHLCK